MNEFYGVEALTKIYQLRFIKIYQQESKTKDFFSETPGFTLTRSRDGFSFEGSIPCLYISVCLNKLHVFGTFETCVRSEAAWKRFASYLISTRAKAHFLVQSIYQKRGTRLSSWSFVSKSWQILCMQTCFQRLDIEVPLKNPP